MPARGKMLPWLGQEVGGQSAFARTYQHEAAAATGNEASNFSEGWSSQYHSDPASQLPASVPFPVYFCLWSVPVDFKPWTDVKISMLMLSELPSEKRSGCGMQDFWLKHCYVMPGGQNSCSHVCSWIGQTTATIWNRLWWQIFSQSLARLLHGQQNGEAKCFPHIVNHWLKNSAEPERFGSWRF